jgi:hypothetical protein
MGRIFLAALAGSLAMFFWGFVTHVLIPLGTADLHVLKGEDAAIAAVREHAPDPGFYLYPGLDMRKDPTEAEQQAWAEKYKQGPHGFLVVSAGGDEGSLGRWLGVEFATNFLAALVAAFLLARIAGTYGQRVVALGLVGLIAWLSISASYWNWYGFPGTFVASEALEQVLGWILSGLVMARIVAPPAA